MKPVISSATYRMGRLARTTGRMAGRLCGRWLPSDVLAGIAEAITAREPQLLLEALGPALSRSADLDHMPRDLPVGDDLRFEHLTGLFASTSLDHGVIAMTVRQAAYVFGVTRSLPVQRAIEIGRYKGGSTLAIAAGMAGRGEFWSIDIGEKEARHRVHSSATRPYDVQLRSLCDELGLRVHLLVGDSRTIELHTGEVDLVLIDGDHSYEGVRNDFMRFGTRVRVGGAVLFDDAFDEGLFRTHSDSVGRLVREVVDTGQFRLAKVVNRLAHLERISSSEHKNA